MWVTAGLQGDSVRTYYNMADAELAASLWNNAVVYPYGYDRYSVPLYAVWIVMPEGWAD